MGRMTTTVHDSAQASVYARLSEGSEAPDFTLPAIVPNSASSDEAESDIDSQETSLTLSEVLKGGRKVVLYFYPAAMTPGCTTEACDFRDNLARLASKNVTVLGVSKDVHKLYGAYGEKKLYGKVHVGVIRSTLVINPDGSVVIARYNVRAKGHVDSLLKALDKLEK